MSKLSDTDKTNVKRGEWSVTRSEGDKVLVELTAEQFEALKALKEHQL